MKYAFEKKGRILTVTISGELDHHNAAPLRTAVDEKIISSGARGLVLDFSGLEMMDSSGIGVIMGRCRLMESLGGHVCVSGTKSQIRKIILLSGLGKLVGVCDTAEQGRKLLENTARRETV